MRSAREASSSSDGTQRVSLKDIADELGISQTAVSFAINRSARRFRGNQTSGQRGCSQARLDAGLRRTSTGILEDHDHRLCPRTIHAGAHG